MFRGFIAVEVEVTEEIKSFMENLKRSNAKIKLVEPENLHLTLKFLGDTREDKIEEITSIIEESSREVKPFEITLEKTGVFPNPSSMRVIWIGVTGGEKLKTIADKLDEKLVKLGYKKEGRGFKPHLTIARVKKPGDKNKIKPILEKYKDTCFGRTKIEEIHLKKSTLTPSGPIYITLREVKL